MSNAQQALLEVIRLAGGPVEPRFKFLGAGLFPGESNRRVNWCGIGASRSAFSAIVEAACEVMESSAAKGTNIMKVVQDAERNGYFAFDGAVHTMKPSNPEEAQKGEQGRVRETGMKPVSIIVRRLPFLEDYDVFRVV